jgi:hypothetical protein
MNEQAALRRVGRFLYFLSAGLFFGTIGELWAVGHDKETIQLLPYALCVLGLACLCALKWRLNQNTVIAVRAVMIVIALSSLLGVYEHITGNLDFAREIHKHASTISRLKSALTGGAPVLAPGILAVAAAIGVAATYASAAIYSIEVWPETRQREMAGNRPRSSQAIRRFEERF